MQNIFCTVFKNIYCNKYFSYNLSIINLQQSFITFITSYQEFVQIPNPKYNR